jgi:hypothetical protein
MGASFKISLKSVPKTLIRKIDGVDCLVLQLPSLNGRKKFVLKDGDILEAIDKLMELSIENFELPKIPMKIRKKDKKGNKNTFEHALYDHKEVKGKKLFTKVK